MGGENHPLRFYYTAHQGKERAFVRALLERGHKTAVDIKSANFLLTDFTIAGLFAGTGTRLRPEVEIARGLGVPVFEYPHSARPNIPYDLADMYQGTRTLFTFSEGHKRVAELCGYKSPIEVVGWSYSAIKKFKGKVKDKPKILFAPIHPVGMKYLPDDEAEINAVVHDLLLSLGCDATVRFIGSLSANGLYQNKRFKYYRVGAKLSTSDHDRYDVIIAGYTYAYMAVALGIPLLMIGESVRPHNSPRRAGKLIYGKHWKKYRKYMRYPYNADEVSRPDELRQLMQYAMAGGKELDSWRTRFIGTPFNGLRFANKLEEMVWTSQNLL